MYEDLELLLYIYCIFRAIICVIKNKVSSCKYIFIYDIYRLLVYLYNIWNYPQPPDRPDLLFHNSK